MFFCLQLDRVDIQCTVHAHMRSNTVRKMGIRTVSYELAGNLDGLTL